MRFILTFLFLFTHLKLQADEMKQIIDIMPVQIQFRYEDSVEQTKATQQYQGLGFNYQRNYLRFGCDISSRLDKTGNASLAIEKKIQEYLFSGGYQLYQLQSQDQKLSLTWFGQALLGQTQTQVKTTLLGSSATSTSDKDWVIGAGTSLVGRYAYGLIETDLKILNSKNMSPQIVPVLSFKFGAGFTF